MSPSVGRRDTPPGLRWRRRAMQALFRLVFRLGARVEARGLDHLPSGPALLVANHLSHTDPALALAVLPHLPEVVGLSDLRQRLIAPLFVLYAVIPVRRDEVDRALLRAVLNRLEAGQQVAIFPEARRSRTGALEPARDGIGYLAMQAQVPVVPVAITGTETLAAAWKARRRPTLTVTVAPPLLPPFATDGPRRAQRHALTTAIMQRLAAHLPPEYRGVYGAT